jgi:hypothetical protein
LDTFDDALSIEAWAAPIVAQRGERPFTLSEYADAHVSYLRALIAKGDTSHGDLTKARSKLLEFKPFSIRYTSDHDNDNGDEAAALYNESYGRPKGSRFKTPPRGLSANRTTRRYPPNAPPDAEALTPEERVAAGACSR